MADDLRGEAVALMRVGWGFMPQVSTIVVQAGSPDCRDNAPSRFSRILKMDAYLAWEWEAHCPKRFIARSGAVMRQEVERIMASSMVSLAP
jgi:hypothetical protein